jgi:hypothetical protein
MLKRSHPNDNDDDDDDDDDYMSDKILHVAAQVAAPQLLNPRRRVPLPTTTTSCLVSSAKSRRTIEVEQREQGLSTAITSDNKGFQLLKKMGYREGSKLGINSSHGLIEPIPIHIHPARSGLGEDNEKKEIIRRKQEIKVKLTEQTQLTYQEHLKQKYYNKRLRIDIDKCQSICERLDRERLHLDENTLWKSNAQEIVDSDDDDDNIEPCTMEDQLKTLTCYLREQHIYCIWCGQAFETINELENTCPGNERDLH